MQSFVTATLEQCRRHRIPSELIIVDQICVSETLRPPKEPGPCSVRILAVPKKFKLGEEVAKSVGIRRARGRYVLAASASAALPDGLLKLIGEQYLRFSSLDWDDIAAKDGSVMLGKGWFWKELDGSKPFRWFNNDAEISIQPYSDATRVLALDIEPGPGVNMGPTTLDVLDDAESKIVTVRLANRRVVNIPLPSRNGVPIRFRLRVSDTGHKRSSDPRPLNARVLRCGLYEAPMAPRAWSVPHRIWWMLTRRAGSSLLPAVKCQEVMA